MLDKVECQDLIELEPGSRKTIDVYKRTQDIYKRTRVALGQISSFTISVSCTQEGKVNYGTDRSTKIYTSK